MKDLHKTTYCQYSTSLLSTLLIQATLYVISIPTLQNGNAPNDIL